MRLFADTFYYVALLDNRDPHHALAVEWAELLASEPTHIWTTDAILLEVGSQLRAVAVRNVATTAIRQLRKAAETTIVYVTPELFDRALSLFEQRPDKEWSLTDCVSFIVMQENKIIDALTGDRHFEQAGFRALLLEEIPREGGEA